MVSMVTHFRSHTFCNLSRLLYPISSTIFQSSASPPSSSLAVISWRSKNPLRVISPSSLSSKLSNLKENH